METNEFSLDKLCKYLQIYNADIDWNNHIDVLWHRLGKFSSAEVAKTEMRKRIAFTILMPFFEHGSVTNPPEALLFSGHKYHQYNSRDWPQELQKIWEQDARIDISRQNCLDLGIIFPIEYVPRTRQALSWLLDRVRYSIDENSKQYEDAKAKMQNLVFCYGGAVICNVFLKEEYKTKLNKIPNWRSGYFFEKLIYEIYNEDQIKRIKEFDLKKVDVKLVKKIKTTVA